MLLYLWTLVLYCVSAALWWSYYVGTRQRNCSFIYILLTFDLKGKDNGLWSVLRYNLKLNSIISDFYKFFFYIYLAYSFCFFFKFNDDNWNSWIKAVYSQIVTVRAKFGAKPRHCWMQIYFNRYTILQVLYNNWLRLNTVSTTWCII